MATALKSHYFVAKDLQLFHLMSQLAIKSIAIPAALIEKSFVLALTPMSVLLSMKSRKMSTILDSEFDSKFE